VLGTQPHSISPLQIPLRINGRSPATIVEKRFSSGQKQRSSHNGSWSTNACSDLTLNGSPAPVSCFSSTKMRQKSRNIWRIGIWASSTMDALKL